MFKRFFIYVFLCIAVSFYLFPVSFSFMPETVNSKMILAVFGILASVYDCIENGKVTISRPLLITALIAIGFSTWCFFSVTINGTDDTIYSRYWLSCATWLGGAYAICFLIRKTFGSVDLEKLTFLLSIVCIAQCILAIIIDNVPAFQIVIDGVFLQGQDFLHSVKRLYGIGASLDSAGVRFAVVLILIAHQLSRYGHALDSVTKTVYYFIAFTVIVIVGSIIARTTWVGALLGLPYMMIPHSQVREGKISAQQISFWLMLAVIVVVASVVSIILYRHNPGFRQELRFGFEGFFNLAETGEFRIGSMDKLNRYMWIWPKDTRTWLIGTGWFGNWYYHTDIGYCRFILFCGLIGLFIFSVYFIYNGYALSQRIPGTNVLALFLIALTFIIWIKVSTDIFFIYALLFFLSPAGAETPPCTSSTT